MEHDRILWLVERTSGLRFGANREGDLETIPALSQALVEERIQRLMVNRRISKSETLAFRTTASSCVELFYVGPSA